MVKTLTKHGNSYALIIDRPILDLLKIDEDTPLNITTDGQSLVISPVDPVRRRKFRAAMDKVNSQWSDVLARLAK
jgi:antitoxin component of MazEF toxin-antitoxin module